MGRGWRIGLLNDAGMATDVDRAAETRPTAPAAGWLGAPRRRAALVRNNFLAGRTLTAKRRRDTRFRVVPFDGFQLANGAALALSLGLLLAIVLDPHLVPWQATLPDGLIAVFDIVTDFGRSNWILIGTGVFFLVTLAARRERSVASAQGAACPARDHRRLRVRGRRGVWHFDQRHQGYLRAGTAEAL